jgi:hypothetical protein
MTRVLFISDRHCLVFMMKPYCLLFLKITNNITPRYSYNATNVGIKHQSIKQPTRFDLLCLAPLSTIYQLYHGGDNQQIT